MEHQINFGHVREILGLGETCFGGKQNQANEKSANFRQIRPKKYLLELRLHHTFGV